jgi:hypothetical protein
LTDDEKPAHRGTLLLLAHIIAICALIAYVVNR